MGPSPADFTPFFTPQSQQDFWAGSKPSWAVQRQSSSSPVISSPFPMKQQKKKQQLQQSPALLLCKAAAKIQPTLRELLHIHIEKGELANPALNSLF